MMTNGPEDPYEEVIPLGGHEFVPCDDDPLECVHCRAQEPR